MAKRVAHLLVDASVEAGVQRVYGVRSDSLNGITDSIRIKKNTDWVHVDLGRANCLGKRLKIRALR
jgi:pyruvate dehydrogenase (quinone)